MGLTVLVNSRTVVHKDSGGKAISVPDFCKTPAPPGPPLPIPYVNLGQSSDTAKGSSSVKADGNPIMLKDSTFSTSSGDEPGSLKGVASSTSQGVLKFANYSFDVKIERKNVPRLGDPMTNNGNAPNTANIAEIQKNLGLTDAQITKAELLYLCKIVCEEAKKKGQRTERAVKRVEKQTRHPRIITEKNAILKALKGTYGCLPDIAIMVTGTRIGIIADFKWAASGDRFRGDQLKKIKKIPRKYKRIVTLNEKNCKC
jgi:hypothetical protein